MTELTLRPEVEAFARAMERKLRDNDHKPHWSECEQLYLRARLLEEVKELWHALENEAPENVLLEAADVANFAMMLADVAGGLR